MSKSKRKVVNWMWAAIVASCVTVAVDARTAQAEDTITRMQRTIDAADERIREITRRLADTGLSSEAIARLNRELKDQQWAKSQAEVVIVRERERERKRRSAQSERSRYEQAVSKYVARQKSFLQADTNFGIEVRQYNEDIRRFNSGRWNQRQYDHLNTWKSMLAFRRDQLAARATTLEKDYQNLRRWEARINALFAGR